MEKAKGSGSKKASSTVGSTSPEQPESARAAPQSPEAPAQQPVVTSEERYRLIAEAAYFRAEARGFQGGDPVVDWLEAEAEINRWFMPPSPGGYASEQRGGSQSFARTQKPSVPGSHRPRPS